MMSRVVWLLALGLCWGGSVAAQTYPVMPIRLVVPSAPGSGPDLMARLVAQELSKSLGKQVITEPRPGAGGSLGAEIAAKAPPDGYTLLMGSAGSQSVTPVLYRKLGYDSLRDFAPIVLVSTAANILIVHPSLPVKSVKDIIALARARPGDLTFGSGGNGSTAHLSGELFRSMAKLNMVHIPFKGAPGAVLGVITGEVSLAILNLPPALPHVQSGKLKALGVSTAKRAQVVPDIPTIAEAGLPGYEAATWYGVLAPAGVANEIVQRINADVNTALGSRELQRRIVATGGEVAGGTPAAFAERIRDDIEKWRKVVALSGARVD